MRKLTGALTIFVLLLTLPAALLVTAQSKPPVFKAVLCDTEIAGPLCAQQGVGQLDTGPPSPFGVAEAIQLDALRTAIYLQVIHLDAGTYSVKLDGGEIGQMEMPNRGGVIQATYIDEFTIKAGTTITVGDNFLSGKFKKIHPVECSKIENTWTGSSLTTAHCEAQDTEE